MGNPGLPYKRTAHEKKRFHSIVRRARISTVFVALLGACLWQLSSIALADRTLRPVVESNSASPITITSCDATLGDYNNGAFYNIRTSAVYKNSGAMAVTSIKILFFVTDDFDQIRGFLDGLDGDQLASGSTKSASWRLGDLFPASGSVIHCAPLIVRLSNGSVWQNAKFIEQFGTKDIPKDGST
jgi:hypothetical protein